MISSLLRIKEYSLYILWFISYLFCTLSSFLLHFILFPFFVLLFCIYIGVSILCNSSIQQRKVLFSSLISQGIKAMEGRVSPCFLFRQPIYKLCFPSATPPSSQAAPEPSVAVRIFYPPKKISSELFWRLLHLLLTTPPLSASGHDLPAGRNFSINK